MEDNMSDEEKLELVHQMCQETDAQDVAQVLKHENEVSDIISSIEDANIKLRGVIEYYRMHEEYAINIFSNDFEISTNERKFKIEDVLDARFGQNIAKIAGTIDDDDMKLKLVSRFGMKMTDEDRASIIATIKSDAKRKEAEALYNISSITSEELSNDEEER